MQKYLFFFIVSVLQVQGMNSQKQDSLKNNNSPVFIKKVTNNSCQTVKMLKSHFFGYIADSEMEPIITLEPGQTKEWQPLIPMPYSSVHFLAHYHAVTMMANGGYEDALNSHTFNTCLLRYFKPDLIDKKLIKDHSYILEIVLGDREKDGQVQFDDVIIEETPLKK